MKTQIRINSTNPRQSVGLPYSAEWLTVLNPTPSIVFVRIGAPDAPTASNADIQVPPAAVLTFPVTGSSFGFSLDVSAIMTQVLAGLSDTAFIWLGRDEVPPSGMTLAYPKSTLSDSALSQQIYANQPYNAVVGPFDLSAWGGLIAAIENVGTSPAVLVYEMTDSITPPPTWLKASKHVLQAGECKIVQLPRVKRYGQLRVDRLLSTDTPLLTITPKLSESEILVSQPNWPPPPAEMGNYVLSYACAAGVWTNTGYVLPTNALIQGFALDHTASALSLVMVSLGTASFEVRRIFGMYLNTGIIVPIMFPPGYSITPGANTTVWYYSSVAGTISANFFLSYVR